MSNWRSLTNGSATKNTGWRSLVPDYKPNSVSNTYSNDEESDERNDDYTKYLKQLLAEQEKQRQLMSQQNAMNETQDSGVMSAQSAMRNGQTWQQKYQSYSDAIDKALAVPNAAYNAGKTANRNTRNSYQQSNATLTTSAKLQQQMEQQVSDAKKQRAADLPGLESKLNGESKPDEVVQAENSLKSPGNLLSNNGTDKNNVFSDSLGGVTPLKQYANNARTVKNYNESTHLTPNEELEYSQAKIEALSDGEQQALAGIKASQKGTGNYLSGGATGSYIKELQQINGSAKYYDTLKKDYGWDQNKIDEYTGYTQRLANAENTEENNQKFSINKDDSTLTKIGKSARNSAYSLANSGSSEYLSLLSNLEDKPKGFGKDSNSWTNSARNASDYAQEQVVNNAITDKHPVGQFAYNAGMSIAESGLNAIYGAAVGGALGSTGALANVAANTASLSQFAASAYNSAYDDARERGASNKQAQEFGVINGLVEAGTEIISLDKVWDLAKGNVRGARNILVNWLTQAGIEGSEEFAGDILDKYADTMVLGKDGNSAKQKSIEAYMAQGMTEEEAKNQYDKDFLKQLGEDTLAGAVSGAVMGAGGLYAGTQNAKVDSARSEGIKNSFENVKAEGNSAYAQSINTMADTYKSNPTQYLADNVDDSTAEGKKAKQQLQKYADKESNGKKLSISDRNDIENMLYENEQTQTGNDNSDYRDQLRYVPSEYRTPISNVSRQDLKTAMESAAQSGDVNALADAYHRGKMSTSADTRDNLEEDYGLAKRMLLNKGTVSTEDLDKATESQQDAYLSGLNGEESDVKSMSDRAATAYTAGYNQYVSNNANSKVGNDVDLHSVTAEDDSGRVTKVVGFASATSSNGQREISLKTTDGNSISYSNANISNTGVAKLYDNAAKQGTVDDMNAYLDNYVKEMPIGQYDNAFNRYYSQGASGTKSFDDLYSSDKYGYKSFMSKNQLQKIYNIGANETAGQLLENAKAEGKSIAVKGTGAVTDLRHNRSDNSYMPFVSSMAKALNLDVVLSDNMEDGINGQFERALQRVTLNTKNKDAMFNTVFHEAFGEYMQAHNAAGANRVRSAVLSYISDTKGADYVSSVGKTYQKVYTGVEGTKTFSDALGESVNDSISGIFSTEEGIHGLRTWLDSKYDEKKSRGILGDIADYFKGVAASLRSLIKDGHLSTASMNTAEMAEKRANDIRKMILKEMDTAAKNAAGTTVDASTKGKANYSVVVDTQGNALTEGQRDYFKNAKTVDENGNLKVFYHGTARADRVGYTFRPDRATSGPMAFFTDNKDIANNYAKDKSDTSLSRDSRYDSYSTQFRMSDGKTDKQISDAWYKLSAAEKKSITDKALSLTEDGDGNIIANKDNRDGLGDLSYKIKSHRGNLISALVEEWLDDGTLFNKESRFTEVLDKAGITEALKKKGFGVEYLDPEARNEGVYEVYLNLTNPYDTSNVSKEDYNGIASWWSNTYQSAYENINYAADPWDKTSTSMDTWLDRLSRGIENGDTHAWTVVPDAVTAYLKEKGYDGILDTGGKNGGLEHTVAIPFYSNQIKNIDNQNPSKHDDIRYSLDLGYHAGDLGKAESLGNQSGGRSTGHFGTGTYFVSDTSKLVGDYNTRPAEEVDFSNYNLYRPASERDGFKLHNFLKGVNSFWNMDDNAIKSEDEWYRLHDRFIDSLYDDGAQENSKEIFDLANRLYGSDVSVNRKIENAGSDVGKLKMLDTYRYADDVPGYLSAYESWNDTIDTAANDLFGITGEEAREIVSDIKSEIDSKNYSLDGKYKADSASTRFMKALGFEGVDVRGYDGFDTQSQGLDNTAYGSVIYDLKGADKQRKDDIGTARYSLEIDDAWDNAWDDAWDDVVNDYDNKQESLVDDMQISLDSASSILAEGAEALKNTEVNKSTVRKVASEIIHNTGSSYGTMALANNLEKVFAYMQSTDNVDYKDLMRVLEEVAQPVIDTSNTTVGKESYKEFMHALKGYKVSLTSKQLAEVKRAYGSLSTFKRLVPGMTFSQNENLSLDSVWDEISEMTGGILDYDTNEGDMPFALADAVEAMKPQVKNNFGGNNRQVAYDTALDIVEKYFDSAATDAANAEAKKQINAAKMKMAETNRNYKAKVREQYSAKVKEERQKALAAGKQKADTVVASLKEKQKETLAKLREEKNDDKAQALREQADHYQERISNIIKQKNAATLDKVASARAANDKRYQKSAEHRKAMHEKAMIDSSATKLFKWLTSPTDTYHIPNDLQKAVSDYISGIDFLSPQINSFTDPKTKTTKYQVSVYDHEARRFVKKVANTQAEAYQIYQNAIEAGLGTKNDRKWRDRMSTLSTLLSKGEMSSDDTTMNDFLQGVDASLAEDFEKILKDNDNTVRLSDLSASDLHTINMLTRNVMSAINHINKAFTSNARISDLAESTINSETKSGKEHSKTVNDLLGLLQVKNATPETYFHFLGEGGQKVYKMLRSDGLNQRTRDVRSAGDYMKGVLKGISGVDKWSTDTHEFDTVENKKIQLNTAQIMTLYEYTKREQAMMHLPGGFSVEKMKINGKEVSQKGLHLSDAQIENIVGTLTEEQKTVADKMQRFMATDCSEWGNRASRSMFGYDKFGDKDYFPIRTEESTHQTQNNNVSNDLINSIKNQGFTKQVVINANNPLVLSDIFDVFTRHVTGMAAYDAYAPAISDALRWYNYRTVETGSDGYKSYGNTVKDAISRVYGDEGKSYFVKLIQNINGNEKGGSELNIIDKTITGFKSAAVGANVRVIMQQPTAYFRANNVLSPKYLAQAMLEMKAYSSDAKAAYKMQDRSSDISWWKSQGYWETSIGKSMKAMITGSESALDKGKNAFMSLAGKADDVTWRKLYLATYLEQKNAFDKAGKSIDGVEFEDAVNDRFDEMIDRTQVVDSTLHRSQLMRSNDTKDKLFTSFMAEPTKSYNMLMRAVYDAYSDKDYTRGAKTVARAAVTYFITSLATECVASLSDATRNDDDNDWWEKYLASLTENYIDDLNPLSLIPFAKDISELVSPYAKKWIAELTGNTDEENTYTTSNEDMSIAAITNLLDAANTDMQYLFQHTSTLTPYGILKKNARALSQITGIPVYNIIRDSVAVYNTLSDVGNWKKLYSKQSDVKAYYKQGFTDAVESGEGIEKALDDYIANGQKLESAENMITDAYKEEYLNLYNEDPEKAKAFADKLNKAYAEVDKLSGAEHYTEKDTTRYENWLKNSDTGKKEKADVFTSIDNGGDYKKEINDALNVGYSYDSIKSSLTSTYKPKFIEAYKSNKSDAAKIKNRLAEVYAYLSDQTGTYKGKSHAYKVKQYSNDIDHWLK